MGGGLIYSESFGIGISAITHISFAYREDYTLAFFAKSDYFREQDSISTQFGLSLGFGSLKSYQ